MAEEQKEKSKTSCVYCEHYCNCYKLQHDRSVYDKGCEDFEPDEFFIETNRRLRGNYEIKNNKRMS